ncbi:heme biosynthesis HemY N-terminal domain-containing protein [Orrella sp. 11846]|uniref:heme biosynthesis HemY N-terminal domain-containing protein n=1 Tax=Orrella sp. 11846 TaxID=3409913 RepID=UPI003B5914BF
MRGWFWTILIVVVAVLLAVVLQSYPGNIVVVAGDWRVQVSLAFGVLIFLACLGGLYFLLRVLNWFANAPSRYRGWRENRRQEHEQIQLETGWAALLEGRYPQAQKTLTRLSTETKNTRRRLLALLSAARSANEDGQRDKRDELLEQAAQVSSQLKGDADMQTAVAVTSAELWLEDNQSKRALAALNQVPGSAQKHLHLMRLSLQAYQDLQQYDKAIDTARWLARKDAISAQQAQEVIEYCAATQLRQLSDATAWMNFWKSLRSQEQLYTDVALAGYDGLLEHDDGKGAQKLLEQAIKQSFDPRLVAAYGRAEPEQVSARLQKAVSWLNQRPDDADLLVTLGALCLTGQMWGQAQRYLERASRQRSDARIHALLGSLYDRIGQSQKAAAHWRLATAASASLPVLAKDVHLPAADLAADPKFHHVEGIVHLPEDEDDDLLAYAHHATGDSIASAQPLYTPSSNEATQTAAERSKAPATSSRSAAYEDYYEFFDSAPIPLDGAPVVHVPLETPTSETEQESTESKKA